MPSSKGSIIAGRHTSSQLLYISSYNILYISCIVVQYWSYGGVNILVFHLAWTIPMRSALPSRVGAWPGPLRESFARDEAIVVCVFVYLVVEYGDCTTWTLVEAFVPVPRRRGSFRHVVVGPLAHVRQKSFNRARHTSAVELLQRLSLRTHQPPSESF